MNKKGGFLDSLTARQLREFALLGEAIRPVSRFFSLGFVPVARQVWRNICKVGCGWLSDRVTMMKGFEWLKR
jgi:hypothetical protein